MLSIFDKFYDLIFPKNKNKVDLKLGDVIYLLPNKKSSQKTRAVIKIYGKSGFIVCDTNSHFSCRKKRAMKLVTRGYIKKFNREDQKIKKKIWVGWIPLEEVSWTKKQKPRYME